ncbi:MAG: UTP--glucose-1-phosphate uridylyltransferase [Myxococcales bacterium]|nr:UTP--glucose-1-phosphate uridylyltransferase [Myxococcales bacterium]
MSEDELRAEIAGLDPALRKHLDAAGFDAERLLRLAAPLHARARGEAGLHERADERNRVRGAVLAPGPGDVVNAPAPGSAEHERLAARGLDAIRRGELAVCVMAGGMATRMGGVVKALVEALPGHTFLDLRLRENAAWSRRAGRPIPLWLMTSEATDGPTRAALASASGGDGPGSGSGAGAPPGRAHAHVATFMQDVGLRLTRDGHLFRNDDGTPSTYSPGHGDLPDALRRSGLLAAFIAAGGRWVWIENLDNLGATIDPAILGAFIERSGELLVEVTSKDPGDKGGIPVWADSLDADGKTVRRLQVLEEFRLPAGFDAAAVRVFNTNTFLVRADALQSVRVRWSWFEVEKKVGDRVAVQFERLLQELTAAMPAMYLRVPREGAAARFLPVKDHDELSRRRGTIEAVARERGFLA